MMRNVLADSWKVINQSVWKVLKWHHPIDSFLVQNFFTFLVHSLLFLSFFFISNLSKYYPFLVDFQYIIFMRYIFFLALWSIERVFPFFLLYLRRLFIQFYSIFHQSQACLVFFFRCFLYSSFDRIVFANELSTSENVQLNVILNTIPEALKKLNRLYRMT